MSLPLAVLFLTLLTGRMAAQVASEPFDYSPGAGLLGQAGGTGFREPWHAAGFNASIHGNYKIAVDSLSSPGLAVTGHRMESPSTFGIAGLGRTFELPFDETSPTLYWSLLLRPEGTLGEGAFNGFFGAYLDGLNSDLFVGKPGSAAEARYVIENRGGAGQVQSGVVPVVGETVRLVVRAQLRAGADLFTLHVNPDPCQPEPDSGAVKSDLDLGLLWGLVIYSTGAFSLDEILLGYSFEEVLQGACQDCNANGIADAVDIRDGFSLDANENGMPDDCEPPETGAQGACTPGFGFQVTPSFGVGRNPASLVAADLNGDGGLDLATANWLSHDASVLLGNGDGTFQSERRLGARALPGDWPFSIVQGDFNGDGRIDLSTLVRRADVDEGFISIHPSEILVFVGKGDGTFEMEQRFSTNTTTTHTSSLPRERSFLATDLNNDGQLDLAMSTVSGIGVWHGNGDGTFQDRRSFVLGEGPGTILAADLNGDGWMDLAKASGLKISLLLGSGDGTFQAEQPLPTLPHHPDWLVAEDLNGDGRLDFASSAGDFFASADNIYGVIFVLLGRGDGTFDAPALSVKLPHTDRLFFVVADLNGDARLDIAAANESSVGVSVLAGAGDGTFQTEGRFATRDSPGSLIAADLNGDGRLDLATANWGSGDASVLLGNGDGTFQAERRPPPLGDLLLEGEDSLLAAVDLDGDGRLDLVAATPFLSFPDYARRGRISVLLGHGDGTFQPARHLEGGEDLGALAAADLNGDGRLDVATANGVSDDVSVLLGNGDGTFGAERRFGAGDFPASVVAADWNGDGRLDLATANAYSSDVSVLLGDGDGIFQEERRFGATEHPTRLAAVDWNGDGRLDVATVDPQTAAVVVLLGNGDGTFQPGRGLRIGLNPRHLAAGDLNGDGSPDFAIAGDNHARTPSFPAILVLLNVPRPDCNRNGLLDRCDLEAGSSADCNQNAVPDECDVASTRSQDRNRNSVPDDCESPPFHRGDANADGRLDVSDGLCVLAYLFEGDGQPPCLESADANNDGHVDCTDPVVTLGYLFLGTEPPAPPGPGEPCAPDTDPPGDPAYLGCETYSPCS